MIKLFTLENLSAFSSDAVYKICLMLDAHGLSEENICSFESYDELLENAASGLENGDYIIIAAENNDYNSLKRNLAARFMLEEISSPEIAKAITGLADITDRSINFDLQCIVPEGSLLHITYDGLYSGFSFGLLNGVCSMIPLDFSRLDGVLRSYIDTVLTLPAESENVQETSPEPAAEIKEPEYQESASKMVYSLIQVDKSVAIATGEATMWIYDLYDKIDGLSEAVSFIEISDEDKKKEQIDSEASQPEEEAASTDFLSEDSEEKPAQEEEAEEETPSAKTIRHAREAMVNMDTDFGAAISEVYSSVDEDGTENYFAFVAVADKTSTKAKKINTHIAREAQLLLPHCVTVLCETVCQKVDSVGLVAVNENENKEKEKAPKKMTRGMIIFAAAVLAFSIICPILIVHSLFKDDNTKPVDGPVIATGDYVTESTTEPSATTEQNFPGITTSDSKVTDLFGNEITPTPTLDPTTPAEPPATEVTVPTTSPNVSSTKGTFTFYVFGYGHGVGMSQYGANYLASQGWNYAQILANYYYGTTLVSGDTYPATIKYNGTDYNTRDYLAGVLEGEMGGSFNMEALKAQAVAAYTFAKYYGYSLGTDSNAYKPSPSVACYNAVDEVMKNGLYISYGGQTALTPFHSMSAGITTSFYNVWGGTAVPYLSGGRPSYVDYYAPEFKSTFTITSDELKSLAESKNLGIKFSGDPATWISIMSHDACINSDIGYVSSMNVGGVIMTGNDFRAKVMDGKIRSHCFTIVYTPTA